MGSRANGRFGDAPVSFPPPSFSFSGELWTDSTVLRDIDFSLYVLRLPECDIGGLPNLLGLHALLSRSSAFSFTLFTVDVMAGKVVACLGSIFIDYPGVGIFLGSVKA